MTKARKVELFDTSLRDGLQQPDLEISVPNAVLLLQRMAGFGVRYAEIGFAGANQFVSDLTSALTSVDTDGMNLALFGRTRGRGAKVETWPDLQFIVRHKRRVPVAVIVVKSRLLDVERSLGVTPEENLLMTWETVEHLHANGLEVFVDLEHAMDANSGRCENGIPCNGEYTKRSVEHFRKLVDQCVQQKVSRIVVCDTNGGSVPKKSPTLLRALRAIILLRNSAFTGIPIAAWASPTHAQRSWPEQSRCRERSSARANVAAT